MRGPIDSLTIGGLTIPRTAALGPMASVADRAYRLMCKEYGAAYLVSEMVSSKGLVYGDKKSDGMCTIDPAERPYGLQLFGEDPDFMGKAAALISKYEPDIIDINMGCPVPKVVNSGSGSALMKDPERAGRIIEATVKNSPCPVTVKIRAGWSRDTVNAPQLALIAQQAGASAVAVHGRTRDQYYTGQADWEVIKAVKQAVTIPVIGNGDVTDGPSCKAMYEQTGCDLVMVARGSYGRPWVFRDIVHYLETGEVLPEPEPEERMETMLRHCKLLCRLKGEERGMKEARKNAAWYVKGLPGSAQLRRMAGELSRFEDAERLAEKALEAKG